jgi:PAS domain S-box-containing protein
MTRGAPKRAVVWVRRNGVALTVLVGLVLMGLFAVTQSGVAILAVARFGAGFSEIAGASLPNLVAASRLSELTQALVATAPEIAAAGSQVRRQAIAEQLSDRLAALTAAIDNLDQATIDPQRLAGVRAQLAALALNLSALDGFVQQRIDADDAFEAVMARLPALAARVREVVDQAGVGPPSGDPATADRTRLIAWTAAGLEGITLMLATPSVRTASRLERVNAEFEALVARMEGLREQLSPPLRSKIDDMHRTTTQFGHGSPNIFQARRVQIEAAAATGTALRLIETSSGGLAASVSAILGATQEEIAGRAAYFHRTAAYFNLLIVATLLLSVAAGIAIFLYMRRAVITRLRNVQDYMRAEVEGRPAEMATRGVDEIAEIATATQVFVTRLGEREGVLRSVLDNIAGGVVMVDREQRITAWNPEYRRLLELPDGYPYVGQPMEELVRFQIRRGEWGAVDEEVRARGYLSSLAQGTVWERTRPNGTILEYRRNALPEGAGIVSIVTDVTERRRYQQKIEESERRTRTILEASPIGAAITTEDGRALFTNARWRELAHISDDQVETLDVRAFFASKDDRRRVGRMLREHGRVRDVELEFRLLDGTLVWMLLSMERIVFEGQPAFLSWSYDYSERRRVAEELREAKDAAEAATKAKSTFLATMSHEIRTPMNGVLGMVELLQETPLDAKQREMTDIARDSASSLLKVIDDILDFSKIEAGRIEIEPVPTSPLGIVESVADALAIPAHKKKLRLVTVVDASVPPIVEADPVRLRQILFNLVGNAIKFTERGDIVVRLIADAAAPGGMMLRAEVRDTGIGLSPEARARLFQPFVQADGSTTRRFGGTGLGLSICRRLVEHMGGAIGVDSTPGHGSTFWFTIAVAPSAAPAPPEPDLAGLCILVVDDDPTVLDMLKGYLALAGAQVEVSRSTDAGLALLKRYAAASILVDAVIVGATAPGTAALAFRRALDRDFAADKQPRLLLLAPFDAPGARARALDAGFAAYAALPIRRASLLRGLSEMCGRGAAAIEAGGVDRPAPAATLPDRNTALAAGTLILVAEDNPTNQLVVARQLAELGYAADLAGDGKDALARFRTTRYALVVTDIHMPEMDGLELTAAIRELERAEGRRRAPILALTADVLVSETERFLAAGIDDHLRKPVSLTGLQDAMARWLPQAATAAVARPPAPAPAAVLNLEQMRRNFGTRGDTTLALLNRYVESTARLIADIDQALAARRVADVREAAHSALGASRTAGAEQLAAILADLQMAIKTEAWDHATALHAELMPAFARVREAVRRLDA